MNDMLEHLNSAQEKAVLNDQGPFLIIAGAGTGKTKVIISRILYLLLEKKIPASQILALTFTEKAMREMVERIDIAMPLSYEEVTIRTFHGFCDQILRETGHEIGIDTSYQLLNQAQQWIFFKKNLYSFHLDYYRPLGNPRKFFHDIIEHFSRLKDEDVAPEMYLEYAGQLLKQAYDDITREVALKSLELATAYQIHHDLMLAHNVMDFSCLQYYALRLLEKRKSILQYYQERYKYIVVDEFQDTNFSQNKLVFLLAKKYRNLMVVGDDDQSIYKWRGASLSNILNFKQHFPETSEVVLTENYRSTQNILDASYFCIQNNNPDRLEFREHIDKKLQSQKGSGFLVEIWHFSSYLEESQHIVQKIQQLKQEGKSRYKDFAILVRTNNNAKSFVEALKEAEIPFSVRDTSGLLFFEEIKDLLAFLRFLVRPQDDIAFFRLLTLPFFHLPMSFLLKLADQAKNSGYEPLFFFLQKFLQKASQQLTLPNIEEDFSSIEKVYKLFERLLEFKRGASLTKILGEFLHASGYIENLTAQENSENTEKLQHFAQFSEIARSFEIEEQEGSLNAFLEYLDSLQEVQGFSASTVFDDDAVAVLTIHSAKGLEFDYVFLPSMVAQRFPSVHRRDVFEIPEILLQEQIPAEDHHHVQEERRLFYVACTRAKQQLFLSYSDRYEGSRKWKISPFLQEISASQAVKVFNFSLGNTSDRKVSPHKDFFHGGSVLSENPMLYLPPVQVNQLSYSKLDTFQTCPLKYKFRYLFQIPSPSAHAANFGSSLHNTLNEFFQALKKGEKPSLDLLKTFYEQLWIGSGYESKAHEQTRKQKGFEMLECFYARESENGFVIPAYLERNFSLKIGSLRFVGRIDRIDQLPDGSYEIIDYKTGTSKRDQNPEKDLQLSLYALACKDIFHLPCSSLSLYFLEDGMKISTTRSNEQLLEVQNELLKISGEIALSDFYPTPGYHCSFCEYRLLCPVGGKVF